MSITLEQILRLVGKLDDSPGEDSARERFRGYLQDNVREIGQVRDYVDECLRKTGDQYNRALQDLVNYVGRFLGFEVTFGRYRGVQGEVGFDGHWVSPTGFHIVVEVKTTEAYSISTAILVGYVDALIAQRAIPDWGKVLGLYVVGRPDPESHNLENSIIAENRTNQLRIISANSLLSLAEMMNEYDIRHEDILAVIKPSGPTIDSIADLMARLAAQGMAAEYAGDERPAGEERERATVLFRGEGEEGEPAYWLAPVKSGEDETAEECIADVVGEAKVYAIGDRTPGRRHIKRGDRMCFYATGKGVVAHATVVSAPERQRHPRIREPENYPWVIRLDGPTLYLDEPVVIDGALRAQLDAFRGRDPAKPWAWFVQGMNRVTEHDFRILTRQERAGREDSNHP
ncbi:MAG: hypothetical protein B1H03_06555 [Planctomycetales bacterium 4484_113]|nr:MAG: hypothetical protein B1H03_06555 [Planctomycetales bacterium 4484_113]